jgi:putative ABC transport system ATP-binding protein
MRVRLEHVTHIYPATDESPPVQVLTDVSLEIRSGDFAVVMGASGSGKSTLLNLIGAVDRPTSGRLFLGDQETSSLPESALTMLRRQSIGFIFQFFNLIPTLNVFENVAFPLSLNGRGRSEIDSRVREVLDRVGLPHRATHFPGELAGGEMQRVAIGRAIIHRPSLILADEPTGNLDSRNGETVLDLIRSIHDESAATVVMATHSARAASRADYVIHIADGQVTR